MTPVTPIKKEKFLKALTHGASVARAAAAGGFSRWSAYRIRHADAEFAAAWDDALEAGTDALEDEAVRRAKTGVKRPVYQGGVLVGHVREYSDTLLIFMLKARRPEKFKERIEQHHRGSIDVASSRGDLSRLTAAELDAYEALLAKMQADDVSTL